MPTENELHEFDNYMPCNSYYTESPDEQGFHRFENDGLFYFAYFEGGKLILRSEGYDNEPGRDNGIRSVLNNVADDAMYGTMEDDDGKWVLILFAKNNQEIARTCPFDSKEEALQMMPSARLAAMAAAGPVHHRKDDDYLLCSVYEHIDTKCDGQDDFVCFKHDDGKFYFAWLSPSGKVILRSEGYPTTSAREHGIASVIKNRDNRDQYVVEELHGRYFVYLKAGNNLEIGRSCPLDSETDFWTLIKAYESHRQEDDYLVCREYEEMIEARCGDHHDFICFFHPSTHKYYFAWVTANDHIILRSEGYPSEAARNKGIESVVKNREDRKNFHIEGSHGVFFLVLKAANNQEIARSCPMTSEAACWALLEPATPLVAAAAPLAAAAMLPVLSVEDKHNDYLRCEDYAGHTPTADQKHVALFNKDGKEYFVIYYPDGRVRWRSEGFVSLAKRTEELTKTLARMNNTANWEEVVIDGKTIEILRDEHGHELARSCPEAVVAAAPIPPPPAGGFNWWWLLPLLLIPLFFLWRGCDKKEDTVVKQLDENVTPPVVVVDSTPDCGLAWILFDYDKDIVVDSGRTELEEVAALLKKNPDYRADLKGYTDGNGTYEYNVDLSRRRALNCEKVLLEMGIDSSRIEAEAMSQDDPAAVNTVDDSGRHFNRRVEVYILDATGKRVCRSIKPDIPYGLQN